MIRFFSSLDENTHPSSGASDGRMPSQFSQLGATIIPRESQYNSLYMVLEWVWSYQSQDTSDLWTPRAGMNFANHLLLWQREWV